MSTKIHAGIDSVDRALSIVVTGGKRNDGAVLREATDDIQVPRVGGSRQRGTPDVVLADRAYPTKATREYLRSRGIKTVSPEKIDQVTARKKKGSSGGRPPKFNAESY